MTGDLGDSRILRDRLQAARTDLDLTLAGGASLVARRQLLQVVDGGAMPSQPDHYFLGNPVDLGGSETEGGAAASATITSATVPFVALWHAPSVGDLVVATAVGKRWVAERTGASPATVCIEACYPYVPVYGALVQIYTSSGGTLLASCTTGSSGCCTFNLVGSYYITVTISDSLVYTGTETLASGGSIVIPVADSSSICCSGYLIPKSLTLTDAIGQIALSYVGNSSPPLWTGTTSTNVMSVAVVSNGSSSFPTCAQSAPSVGPVGVCYSMTCQGGSPAFSVRRFWNASGSNWLQYSALFPAPGCTQGGYFSCDNQGLNTDGATLAANPTSDGPFALSGTPTVDAGSLTGDPVGGSIAISA